MPSLALLSNGVSPHNDNHRRILSALDDHGWYAETFAHSEIAGRIDTGDIVARDIPLTEFDLVWMLGLGEQRDFLDRCQLLTNLPQGKLVNSALAMLALHSKYIALPHSPPTLCGNRPDWLLAQAMSHGALTGSAPKWVVKPVAGSYGRDVRVTFDATTLERELQRATAGGKYCVLQMFVPEIEQGETRSLVLNGQIIGSYLRIPSHDFLANLSEGARARSVALNTDQEQQVLTVARALDDRGVRFAAIDMAFPYLIEVNIANPGGLATLASLDGGEPPSVSERLVSALSSLLEETDSAD